MKSADRKPEKAEDGAVRGTAIAMLREMDRACVFGPSFFLGELGRFVLERCPTEEDELQLLSSAVKQMGVPMAATLDSAVRTAAPATRFNWSPYLTGIGIGVLSWIVFVVANNPIGITTALSQVSGGAATLFVGADVVAANRYWARNAFRLDYGTLFLVGAVLGGLGSSLAAGAWRIETVPRLWAERFGPSPAKRYVFAFIGGTTLMYGARLANGCTSGNGISGGLQLALYGWVFLAVMFATGTTTAFLMFRPRKS